MKILFCFAVVVLLTANAVSGQGMAAGSRAKDSIALEAFLGGFLDAFRSLDWEPFYACFSEEATAFFPPSAKFPLRANNKEEIGKIFKGVFENVRKHAAGTPYLTIEPKDMKIQLLDGVAIVSFLLDDPGMLGRRTLLCRKEEGRWRIIHLHASGEVKP